MSEVLRAPYPAFGGKGRAAALIWERFGRVVNFVDPMCRSLAVPLACPKHMRPRVETVNDLDAHIANAWRSIAWHAEETARACDWPVNEVDLHARHKHLLARIPDMRARLDADPKWCDPEIAGWYIWGASAWIGSGWCEEGRAPNEKRAPDLSGGGAESWSQKIGAGVHAAGMREPSRQLPHLVAGMGVYAFGARTRLYDLFAALSERLRHVRVTCGDWSRICTPAVTYRHGLTAVLLDPPYEGFEGVYGSTSISAEVRAWAIENGERPDMRIALCGYEGEHDMPATWECVAWKAKGGYGNQRKDGENENARRERIWFSPACLKPGVDTGQIDLFSR